MKIQFITWQHITEALGRVAGNQLSKPNHRLLAACWAALHEGYRGKKYDGPNRADFISKLAALYSSENVAAPSSSYSLDGAFFEEALRKDDSFDAIRSKVADAIGRNIRAGIDMDCDGDGYLDVNDYAWVQDIFPSTVVYSMNGRLFQCDYTLNDDDTVTLGAPQEVEMSYTPVAMGESQRTLVTSSESFKESAYDSSTGKLTLTIIRPGFNKSKERYYPPSTLKRDHKIFEGAKMFLDHQTESEAKQRPEGSVRNWVANVTRTWAESDGTVKGEAAVIDPALKAKLEELRKQNLLQEMGVSIRAIGQSTMTEIEGTETAYVDSLLHSRSVDFVTYAGAGGQVEAMEAHNINSELDVDLVTEAQLRKRRPELIALIESHAKENTVKTLEQQLQESQADNARLKTELQESKKTAAKAAATAELTKLLTESKMPALAQERIRKQFADADKTVGMKEAIVAEQEYIKHLGGNGSKQATTKNMGANDNGINESSSQQKPNLTEAWRLLGLNEKEATLAASR